MMRPQASASLSEMGCMLMLIGFLIKITNTLVDSCEILVIKTTGDKILDVPLARIGDRGLFVKEIEEARAVRLIIQRRIAVPRGATLRGALP